MVTYHEITPAGLANLKQEVADLKAIRPAKIKNLAEAAALGDRSENAEYSAAKRELRQLDGRLRYLDKLIRYAKVTTPAAANLADIGNWVTLEFDDDQDEDTYELVGPAEAGMGAAKLAINSPLGAAVRRHHVGDKVTVTAPSGTYQVTVMAISPHAPGKSVEQHD